MGLNFRDCHPKESIDKVIKIVDDMKKGTSDNARFWIDLPLKPGAAKHKILIEFLPSELMTEHIWDAWNAPRI